MHISILHYAAPPIIGGVESVIYQHATHLAAQGHVINVIAGRGEVFDPSVGFHKVELVDSRHSEILALKAELDQGRVPDSFSTLRQRLVDLLRPFLNHVDVLIAHNILSLHKNLPLTAALRIITEHDPTIRLIAWHHDLAWKAARYLPEMHEGYPWELLRQPWPNTHHVAVSKARQRDVAEVFGVPASEVSVVPGGVDVASFLKIDPGIRQRLTELGLMQAKPWLLLPARITRRKNIELAIQVVAALRKAFPQVLLLVTGPPGPHNPDNAGYLRELTRLRDHLALGKHVLFLTEALGESPDDEMMRALYHLSDAMLLPSQEEGFGLPILEAALARLPIFCADIPALRELAGDDACYFAPDDDAALIADQIAQNLLLDRTALLRHRVLNNYDWQKIMRNYVEPLLLND